MVEFLAQRIHISERTYYALMQSGKEYALSKRGQIILKVYTSRKQLNAVNDLTARFYVHYIRVPMFCYC